MKKFLNIVSLQLFIIIQLQKTSAYYYELGVQLHSYSNSLNLNSLGDSCEGPFCSSSCVCDTKFTFCLRPSGSLQDNDVSNCPLGVFETSEFEEQNNINFNQITNLGNNLSNPFFYRTNGNWPGSFQLYVRVVDVDGNSDDLIANIYVDMPLTPSPSFTTPRTFSNSSNAFLEMSFRVECTDGSSENGCPSNMNCTNNNNCDMNAFCIDTPGNFTCTCNSGYTGDGFTCTASTCLQGSVRLRGGTATQGRVEICYNNVWGTVCDNLWGIPDAQVVCRQLGFSTSSAVALTSGFTNGAGQIWLDNVQCHGTETKLIDCPANPLGIHSCFHSEDAGVRCQAGCITGAIRLQGGTATQGHVEICNNNVWGTVCDDSWDFVDAQVACRQLGFISTGSVAITTGFTNGAGQIWLGDVRCRGTETRLIDCPARALGTHNCGHSEDAGVRCSGTTSAFVCSFGDIRLQGGTATQGRVEICNNNVWGTVCDDLWGTPDAQVVCRQLGFATTGAVALTSGFTNGVGQIWLDNVHCRGTETRLIDCLANPLGTHNCRHTEDAGVRCSSTCLQGSVRLQGGTATQGRVEICNNNVWGTVCDDLWGTADAEVVCRQLGYSPNSAAALTSGFTNGAGQIWLDNVHCRGTETRLIDCPANPLGIHNCRHTDDAGVRCSPILPSVRENSSSSVGPIIGGVVGVWSITLLVIIIVIIVVIVYKQGGRNRQIPESSTEQSNEDGRCTLPKNAIYGQPTTIYVNKQVNDNTYGQINPHPSLQAEDTPSYMEHEC